MHNAVILSEKEMNIPNKLSINELQSVITVLKIPQQ